MSKKSKGIGSILRKEAREKERENSIYYRFPKLDLSANKKNATHKITEVTVDGERLIGHIEVCDRSSFRIPKKLNGSGGLLFSGVSSDYVANGLQADLERAMRHSEKIHHDLSEIMQGTTLTPRMVDGKIVSMDLCKEACNHKWSFDAEICKLTGGDEMPKHQSALSAVKEIMKQNTILSLTDELSSLSNQGVLTRELFEEKRKKIEDTIASMSEEYKEMNKAVYRKIEEHIKVIGESLGDE
mgnify:CR=1 FL=1